MKIKSYAGGGIAYLPTTTNRGEAASAASSSSSSSKVPGFADKIIDMVRSEGIDSDVNAITEAIKMEGVELKEVKIDTEKGILEIKASLPFGGTDDNEDRSTSFLQ